MMVSLPAGPTVEILMGTYNGEKFVKEQICSLLEQTYPNIRVFVRDDGSSDQTRQIVQALCEQYPEKITLCPTTINQGVKSNFSALLEIACADYVMFCDQDDLWHKDKVELTLAKMQELECSFGKDTPVLVHTDLRVVNRDLIEISPSFWNYACLDPHTSHFINRMIVQNVVTGCTVMMNRALVELVKPIPQEAVMHDWWAALVATAFGHIGVVEKVTIDYRQHQSNQLGATKYSFFSQLRKKTVEILGRKQKRSHGKHDQMEAFYTRYQEQLDDKQKKIINTYLHLPQLPYLKQRFSIFRHQFFGCGFIRKLFNFFFSKQP